MFCVVNVKYHFSEHAGSVPNGAKGESAVTQDKIHENAMEGAEINKVNILFFCNIISESM